MNATSAGQTGQALAQREKILTAVEARRRSHLRIGQRVLLETLLQNGLATSDDVRERMTVRGDVGWGFLCVLHRNLQRDGLIVCHDLIPSRHPLHIGRALKRWRLTDPSGKAARTWLDSHPELPGPSDEVLFDVEALS